MLYISSHYSKDMEDTMFNFFSKSVQSFPGKDFQRIKKSGSFYGVTYKEAYDKVLEIGNGLMSFGVKKDDKVALICDNRPEWILINLALQGIGAPDVPRDTDVPLQQLEGIVEDSEPRFMILENESVLEKVYSIMDTFPFVEKLFVIEQGFKPRRNAYSLDDVVNEGRALLKQENNSFLEATEKVSPNDISTIVYTSGTQGIPKGVILTHSNFAYLFDVVPPLIELNENDTVLSFLPPWHLFERAVEYFVFAIGASMSYTTIKDVSEDLALEKPTFFASVPRVWVGLYEKRVIKEMKRRRFPPYRVSKWLLEKGVAYKKAGNIMNKRYPESSYGLGDVIKAPIHRVLYFIPFRIAEQRIFKEVREALGGNLRGAVFGGGHLPRHVENFLGAANLEVLEAYGMTEAAPVVSVRRFGGKLHTAGKAIPGTDVRILDEFLNPVEPGQEGVIYVRGPQIMRGYTNPELTRSVLSPSSDGSKLKWYNTADFGKMTPEGELIIKGRADDRFKLQNAEWVIPQPIEDAISTSEYIHEVMVLGADQKFVGALVFPEWENLMDYARQRGIKYPEDLETAHTYLSQNEEISALIEREIRERVSEEKGFRPWEEPVKTAIVWQELRVGAELTATLKLKRPFITEKYKSVIERLFS